MNRPRFIAGIDLGTTNSAVAYVDTSVHERTIAIFSVTQFVAQGEFEAGETLPSFHYSPAAGEFASMRLPWQNEDPAYVAGIFARDHGASVPGRLIVSAKSWLSHSGVDRTANLLPWHGAPDVEKLSPMEVSARYLGQIRSAWNFRFPDDPLEKQEVVITIPASFDEIARELTVAAAQRAGLPRIVLLEEPQAAFYSWIYAHGTDWSEKLQPGQRILVCDVGGGTTDFTLIQVQPGEHGEVRFHRFAVGDHLILGGDNLDVTLAHFLEARLTNGGKLDPRTWSILVRHCQHVKERLLGPAPPEKLTVNVPAAGARLIAGSRNVPVSHSEAVDLLVNGFLPPVGLEEKPAKRASGFQEFGLPYAPDHAITKYLAAFLTAHRVGRAAFRPASERAILPGGENVPDSRETQDTQTAVRKSDPATAQDVPTGRQDAAALTGKREADATDARPDIVLLNGGLFESPQMRKRLLEVICSWFRADEAGHAWKPVVLENERLDLAVAVGAAYYGLVRRGLGIRISGGLARSYYIGVHSSGQSQPVFALCLVPAGLEEGQEIELERDFELLIRQPVEFPLYISSARTTDNVGELVPVDPAQLSALPPIRTVLRAGKRTAEAETVRVRLHARLTEIGTLEVWCRETAGPRKWKLQFDVRAATQTDVAGHAGMGERAGFVDEALAERCLELIRRTFEQGNSAAPPEQLVKRMEQETAMVRSDWPPSLLRRFWEVTLDMDEARKRSVSHEARWLNLLGFALRPGYGVALDDWRVSETWRLFDKKVEHSSNELCRAEWWIFWRRIAGGLVPGQQRILADPLVAALRSRARAEQKAQSSKSKSSSAIPFKFGSHETQEVWRLLGSLELLATELKIELGELLLGQIERKGFDLFDGAAIWALGRLGARIPMYGPLNLVVPSEAIETWVRRLLAVLAATNVRGLSRPENVWFALMQLARRTGDRYRDLSDGIRADIISVMTRHVAARHYAELVSEGGRLEREEQEQLFGESLPAGLRIV